MLCTDQELDGCSQEAILEPGGHTVYVGADLVILSYLEKGQSISNASKILPHIQSHIKSCHFNCKPLNLPLNALEV